ncbi:MAG: hypothetical protein IJP82_11140 [Bacteroidaceae bacterium]|nr:hypothetical protein [Bacteroidaceae bacterium]
MTLLTVCGWQSCSTSDDGDAPITHEGFVTVDLALNVSTNQQTQDGTRMSADIVQGGTTPAYRGIQDLRLFPFGAAESVSSSDQPLQGVTDVTEGEKVSSDNQNYLKEGIDLYIGTKSFLSYGRAKTQIVKTGGGDTDEIATKFKNGSVIAHYPTNIAKAGDVTFDLEPIKATNTADAKATAIAESLTEIANVEATVGGVTKSWKDIPTGNLKLYFENFTGGGNLIAGSSANAQKLVAQLNADLVNLVFSTDDTENQAVRDAIVTKIGTTTIETGYPANMYLPDGSAVLKWDETTSKFQPVVTKSSTDALDMNDPSRYVYPAELYYYGNSPIRTSTNSQKDKYTQTWENVLNHYSSATEVAVSTQSVAIEKPLDYGVACLVATIVSSSDELKDADGNNVSVANSVFPLKAILIAGQLSQAFNFEPVEDDEDEHIIYDIDIPSVALSTTESTPIYTLTFSSRLNKPVNVVLEFENKSGALFHGYNGGIVYPDTKFYLAGRITPSTNVNEDEHKQRVFTHDYQTTVQLKIGSLKNAYNVIPDLKSAQYDVEVVNFGVKRWTDVNADNPERHSFYNW